MVEEKKPIQAVVFDMYGTLLFMKDARGPSPWTNLWYGIVEEQIYPW